jgi:glycosyltransferase involved in cell wall biosynthesis
VVAILVVSDHNQAHLQFAYPHQMIRNVRLSINPDIFSWRPLKEKKPQIACIPKNQEWLATLYHTLQSRAAAGLNRGKDFQWVFLVDRTEQQIAQILADSVLFVFPNIAEGLGRMPLEAMLCGCLPVAWRYGPLKETLPAYMNFEWGSILEMAAFIERVMEAFPDRLDAWEQIAKTNRELALTYSVDRQERSVLAAWEEIVRIHGSR